MGTKITFENSTFQDLIKKVAVAAPTSGIALELTPGIMIEYFYEDDSPDHDVVCFRATNGDIKYSEWTIPLDTEGDELSHKWLVSENLLSAIASGLPVNGANKVCTLSTDETGNFLEIRSGSIRCKLPLSSRVDIYPEFGEFDPDDVELTTSFADRINLVSWACATGSDVPLNGVHFDGVNAVATDRYKMAIVPCSLKVDVPFTVPGNILPQLIKANGGEDSKAACIDGRLLIMPTSHVQIQVATYAAEYRDYKRIVDHSHTNTFRVGKAEIIDIVQRVSNLVAKERMPGMQAWVGKGQVVFSTKDVNGSQLRDILPIPGFADHPRVLYSFTPAYLLGALNHAPGSQVEVSYWANREDTTRPHWLIASDDGYEVWLMTRKDARTGEG